MRQSAVKENSTSEMFFCVHENCQNEAKVLKSLDDVKNHQGQSHKVIDYKQLRQYINMKFSETDIIRMQTIVQKEQKLKNDIKQYVKVIKDKLDEYALQEEKKIPSLNTIIKHLKTVQEQKIEDKTLTKLLKFNVDSITKYSQVLKIADNRFKELQENISKCIQENPDYKSSVKSVGVGSSKWKWSDKYKGIPYKLSPNLKQFEASSFLGYSFILLQPSISLKEINKVVIQLEYMGREKVHYQDRSEGQTNQSFALGLTNLKVRSIRGYDQQDLSIPGHGYYLLRSDGYVCHHTNQELNMSKDDFMMDINKPISMSYNPKDCQLEISQDGGSISIQIDKLQSSELLYFCVHSKSSKCKILES